MIQVDEEICTGCSLCVPACPENTLSCFGTASVDDNCADCFECLEFCPSGALLEMDSKESAHG